MVFYRKITETLNEWRNDPYRKPLVLRGARQTGKTTVVREFGKTYDTFLYVNLDQADDRKFFEQELPVRQLIDRICLEKHVVRNGETLLFIDEIQNSPEAVRQMRYFYEDMPELFVISAGSLLEIMMDMHRISFPVGRVEYRYLFPMTFEEFLYATGETESVKLFSEVPVPRYAEPMLDTLFRKYTMVGGMPEIVARYVETKEVSRLAPAYEALMTSFADDVSKYAKTPAETTIIRHVMETLPAETGKRITFENFGNAGFKSKEAGNALRTLERAMIAYLRYPVTATALPLLPDLKRKPRLQFLDTGLLNYKVGIQAEYYSNASLDSLYNGTIAEQITGQEILASNSGILRKPLFWVRELKQSNAELDFILVREGTIIPVEVKSGKTGTLRSLHSYIDRAQCPLAVRLYSGAYSVERAVTPGGTPFTVINLPLFLCGRITEYTGYYYAHATLNPYKPNYN